MYKLIFLAKAVKELKRLDYVAQKMIKQKLEILAKNPADLKNDIKALKGKLSGKFRLRVRNYRIIYQKKDDVLTILIVRIGHRKEIYK
jgi:mRNA interferase RelE/StbE